MKTVLLVPGYKENKNDRDYAATMRAIKSRGYNVVFVTINWRRTTLADWVAQVNEVYKKYNPAETVLAGFSFGAMAVCMVAAQRGPAQLWLFSLSPYFAEDIHGPYFDKKWLREIGIGRTEAFLATSFKATARSITAKTIVFIGDKEMKKWQIMGERAHDAHKELKNSTLVVVRGVGHDVTHPEYVRAIEKAI